MTITWYWPLFEGLLYPKWKNCTRQNRHCRSDLRTPGRDVNVALEGVVLSLGRCIDLVRPAGLLVGSVSKMDFQKALRALEHAVSHIRAYCDPGVFPLSADRDVTVAASPLRRCSSIASLGFCRRAVGTIGMGQIREEVCRRNKPYISRTLVYSVRFSCLGSL